MEGDIICTICNAIFFKSSELVQHLTLHSKQELSQALAHLQDLLIQCKGIVEKLKRKEKSCKENESKDINRERKHFLFNVISVRDVNILFDNPAKLETIYDKCEDYSNDEQTSCHEEDTSVRHSLGFLMK